jgi:hypothetical protein
MTRINHSHGHSLQELYILRNSKFLRTVDYVVYITSHEQAEHLINMARQFNTVLIPFGGYIYFILKRNKRYLIIIMQPIIKKDNNFC